VDGERDAIVGELMKPGGRYRFSARSKEVASLRQQTERSCARSRARTT
jgi:hypothetical protein